MKKILLDNLLYAACALAFILIIRYFWDNIWIDLISFLIGISPIASLLTDLQKFNKGKEFNQKRIDLSSTFPTFCFMGLYEVLNNELKKIKASDSLEYSLCLVSTNSLHFYKCEKSLMLEKDFSTAILDNLDDLNGIIAIINNESIISIESNDVRKASVEKFEQWVEDILVNSLGKALGRNYSSKTIHMEALIYVFFKEDQNLKLMIFGIPEELANAINFDWGSLIPEEIADGINPVPSWISDGIEGMEILLKDDIVEKSKAIIEAETLADRLRTLTVQRM
ncbi:hypothetical protein [Spirosoma arcticum]